MGRTTATTSRHRRQSRQAGPSPLPVPPSRPRTRRAVRHKGHLQDEPRRAARPRRRARPLSDPRGHPPAFAPRRTTRSPDCRKRIAHRDAIHESDRQPEVDASHVRSVPANPGGVTPMTSNTCPPAWIGCPITEESPPNSRIHSPRPMIATGDSAPPSSGANACPIRPDAEHVEIVRRDEGGREGTRLRQGHRHVGFRDACQTDETGHPLAEHASDVRVVRQRGPGGAAIPTGWFSRIPISTRRS